LGGRNKLAKGKNGPTEPAGTGGEFKALIKGTKKKGGESSDPKTTWRVPRDVKTNQGIRESGGRLQA